VADEHQDRFLRVQTGQIPFVIVKNVINFFGFHKKTAVMDVGDFHNDLILSYP
jgi:hypothetical protein